MFHNKYYLFIIYLFEYEKIYIYYIYSSIYSLLLLLYLFIICNHCLYFCLFISIYFTQIHIELSSTHKFATLSAINRN